MAINLVKGQNIELGLSELEVVLGWKTEAGIGYDLDLSFILLDSFGKSPTDNHLVFYGSKLKNSEGRPCSPCKGVIGSEDDLGDDNDDDGKGEEEGNIFLNKVPFSISEIIILATIYDFEVKRQNFGQARDSYIKIVDSKKNETLATYELDEDFSVETSVEFGRIYRKGGKWKFQAIGKGYNEGLGFFVNKYGLETE